MCDNCENQKYVIFFCFVYCYHNMSTNKRHIVNSWLNHAINIQPADDFGWFNKEMNGKINGGVSPEVIMWFSRETQLAHCSSICSYCSVERDKIWPSVCVWHVVGSCYSTFLCFGKGPRKLVKTHWHQHHINEIQMTPTK